MPNLATNPFNQPVDLNGDIYSGALWHFYENGTTTPKDTYQDEGLVTAHANPVVADSNGRFPAVWLNGTYSIKITDSGGSTIKTLDDYNKGYQNLVDDINNSINGLFDHDTANSSEVGGTGLTFAWTAGRVDDRDGTTTTVAASSLSLTDNATNTVYLDYADNTVKKTTGAPGAYTIALFEVVTASGGISSVTDKRTTYEPPRRTATETVAGELEVSTEAEVDTGTADDKIITPAKLVHVLDGSSTQKVTKGAVSGVDVGSGNNLVLAMRHTDATTHTAQKRYEATVKVAGTYSYNCIVTHNGSGTVTSYFYVNGVLVDSITETTATTDNATGTHALSIGDTVELWTGAVGGSPSTTYYLNLAVSDADLKARGQYFGQGTLSDLASSDGVTYRF